MWGGPRDREGCGEGLCCSWSLGSARPSASRSMSCSWMKMTVPSWHSRSMPVLRWLRWRSTRRSPPDGWPVMLLGRELDCEARLLTSSLLEALAEEMEVEFR